MGELESKYSCYVDEEYTNVLPLDDLVRGIKAHINSVEVRNAYLEKENRKLKDEHYKDAELEKVSQELKQCKAEMRRGFPISEEEQNAINKWCEQHENEKHGVNTKEKRMRFQGCCGGRYTYEFVPTSIGTVGKIKCSCGETFTFSDLC